VPPGCCGEDHRFDDILKRANPLRLVTMLVNDPSIEVRDGPVSGSSTLPSASLD